MDHSMADSTEIKSVCFESGDGEVRVDAPLGNGTAWMTRSQMAALFGCARSVISRHIRAVFAEAEVDPAVTHARMVPVDATGAGRAARAVDHFSLEVVIAVGLRVRSRCASAFRSWVADALPGQVIGGQAQHQIRLARSGLRQVRTAADARAGGHRPHGIAEGRKIGIWAGRGVFPQLGAVFRL